MSCQHLMRSGAAILAGAALLVAAGTARANLIVNGDFEACPIVALSDTATVNNCGWSFEHNAGVNNSIGVGGGKGVRLENNGVATNDPLMYQTVAGLTVGASYLLSWDFRLRVNFSGAGNGPSFGVFLDTQSFASALHLETYLGTVYKTGSESFVATAASHTLIFAGELDGRSNGAGTTDVSYNIDNVSLTLGPLPVAEPFSLALFAPGIAALMRRRRKRA